MISTGSLFNHRTKKVDQRRRCERHFQCQCQCAAAQPHKQQAVKFDDVCSDTCATLACQFRLEVASIFLSH